MLAGAWTWVQSPTFHILNFKKYVYYQGVVTQEHLPSTQKALSSTAEEKRHKVFK